MTKLTRDQILKIPDLRKQGMTNDQIAGLIPCSLRTLHYWIKRLREEGHYIPEQRRVGRPRINVKPQ